MDVNKIRKHLLCDGFLQSYTTWTWHGELLNFLSLSISKEHVQSTLDDVVHGEEHDDKLEDMIRDVGAESFAEARGYEINCINCIDSIVSWINQLQMVVDGVKIDEFEGNKWMD